LYCSAILKFGPLTALLLPRHFAYLIVIAVFWSGHGAIMDERVNPKEVPLVMLAPADAASHFATYCTIQSQPGYFILNFFQGFPPIITGSKEEMQEKIDAIKSLEVSLVSRVILPESVMESYVQAENTNWQRYKVTFADKNDIEA